MVVAGFIGCIDEEDRDTPISGTGKTCAMTGYAKLAFDKGWHIWSNYKVSFADEHIGLQSMITKLESMEDLNYKLLLLVTEIQDMLDSCGTAQKEMLFADYFLRQMRKIGRDVGEVSLYYDNQRFMSVQKRIRIHTNQVLIPLKTHVNNEQCLNPKCPREHKIFVYQWKPFKENPIACFNPIVVGKYYDQYKIIHDKLKLPNKKDVVEE